ncbi:MULTISPECIES: 5-dehydro-4-deoxy-D-glucuronate isomerase [Bacillus]|uniref:5-dehydro-4-deoxy-D-glucuronate isomerase n=1 Tax=Bacillus TaxID=1386 RepID=UPI0019348E54|nr:MULTISPECIES: 5-dehydro-4-deoxy-D-glucuronate isomerase [Bacillus]MDI0274006.1 5-dehydro-4-deoxy-D-glucuronate isomerase [Bacillus safensis]QRF31898.1 5-dehydro-4-deoxy-D-glucuronate isomerase [Bacillus safensis]QRY36941.1 5-dehydro-4-deoxy-D-glucuronate isomerase [Bacillus sp. PDNC022]UXO87695.1 5-dehydro-4-deoxy-D-glucuronate isomerase [Bacillus safensis]WAT80358.1 5-dehydro-4-deoxy-D-glucuronate isomerase [Bacillus safensis]
MENRYAVHPEQVKRFTTEELRRHFHIPTLFVSGELKLYYSHEDRVVIGGAMPSAEPITLDAGDFLRTEYFLERREIGIVNVGGQGTVTVDGEAFVLEHKDFLYIGLGHEDVQFASSSGEQAKFYLVSATAHRAYPTQKAAIAELTPNHLGEAAASNVRNLYQVIHADGIQSCQLMMGITQLETNNTWNTMPAHIHDRRMEVYLYLDIEENARVFHFMGEPSETRHLVVANEEAVISPAWSIHSGSGTANYSFIWAMAGENYTFKDMDFVPMDQLR